MLKKLFSLLILLFSLSLGASCPDISPREVKHKIEEILKAHVSYRKITPELLKRIFENYIKELDPTKTYFTYDEIETWLDPKEELIQKSLDQFNKANYNEFILIHEALKNAISRRNDLEITAESTELPQNVDSDEFNDLPWVKTSEELFDRLLKIKSLQKEVAESLDEETRELYHKMRKKRRLLREGQILGENQDDTKKWVLTHVLKATCCSLDTHTNYFTPTEANQFMIQVQRRLFGIGAQLKDTLNGLTIVRIVEGGPADLSCKLKINDRIIAVDHEPIIEMDNFEAVELIRGEKGTPVLLSVLRETTEDDEKHSEMIEIEIVRGEIVLEESRLETHLEPFADGVIGHLKLHSFYQDSNTSCSKDLQKAIEKIKKENNLKGLILDLRNNAGGLLDEAVRVSGLFITKGIIVSVKDNHSRLHHSRVQDPRTAWDGPLIVLTNRASASAAEIVAGSLQDYGRALHVGDDHTYGKGSFQTFTLDAANTGKVNPKGEFKVTRGRYYTVSGKSPQLTGVLTDITVPGILSEIDIGESFADFPLENDQIAAHYQDDLSDLPLIQRYQFSVYKNNLQEILTDYTKHLPVLVKNSGVRIKNNKNYQSFLTEIAKKRFDADSVEIFGQSDLQLVECINIMKDLIFLRGTV